MSTESTSSGTRDTTYNLVSVLYHTLQGAETCEQYLRDATDEGDEELRDFLAQIQREDQARARRAKELLARRLGGR